MKTHMLLASCFIPLLASGCANLIHAIGLKDCAPVYGNWCGEKYPKDGFNPRPVDAWDRACRAHDKCYDSGQSKYACDDEFIARLSVLSQGQLAPMEMHNAYHYFRRDGFVSGWVNFADEAWTLGASCEGGDGYPSRFSCATNMGACALNPYSGAGKAGDFCHCGGLMGRIVEH